MPTYPSSVTSGSPVWSPMRTRIGPDRRLTFGRRREGVPGAGESDEEGVALGVDLNAAVAGERLAQEAPVLGQCIRVGVAELVQQLRRALDVGEEEGDSAGRERAHLPKHRLREALCQAGLEGLAERCSSSGCDGRSEARTQGASIAKAIGATEDAASGRAARPDGTDSVPSNPPTRTFRTGALRRPPSTRSPVASEAPARGRRRRHLRARTGKGSLPSRRALRRCSRS